MDKEQENKIVMYSTPTKKGDWLYELYSGSLDGTGRLYSKTKEDIPKGMILTEELLRGNDNTQSGLSARMSPVFVKVRSVGVGNFELAPLGQVHPIGALTDLKGNIFSVPKEGLPFTHNKSTIEKSREVSAEDSITYAELSPNYIELRSDVRYIDIFPSTEKPKRYHCPLVIVPTQTQRSVLEKMSIVSLVQQPWEDGAYSAAYTGEYDTAEHKKVIMDIYEQDLIKAGYALLETPSFQVNTFSSYASKTVREIVKDVVEKCTEESAGKGYHWGVDVGQGETYPQSGNAEAQFKSIDTVSGRYTGDDYYLPTDTVDAVAIAKAFAEVDKHLLRIQNDYVGDVEDLRELVDSSLIGPEFSISSAHSWVDAFEVNTPVTPPTETFEQSRVTGFWEKYDDY